MLKFNPDKQAKVYADFCCLWQERKSMTPGEPGWTPPPTLGDYGRYERECRELDDTLRSKLVEIKYLKLNDRAFFKVSVIEGRQVLEIIDIQGLEQGEKPLFLLGTMAGWRYFLGPPVAPATASEYREVLDVVLDLGVKVKLDLEEDSPC